MQAQKIIVIHPGSLYLRIGRASDLNPITILHAIARKRKVKKNDDNQIKSYYDPLLPTICKNDNILNEFETQRLTVMHTIQSQVPTQTLIGAKRLRTAIPLHQTSIFNNRSVPEILESENNSSNKEDLTEQICKTNKDTLYDRDILNLDTAAGYNIHFPMRRGDFNLHSNIGGSMASVLADMESIWLYGLQCLGISPKEIVEHTVVLVIPDIYNRTHLRELVTLLLVRLHFRACFLLQDHVAATFGAGFGYACVVDIGDQKCSISCVEDGISQPDTRVRLPYGGSDITQVFRMLLEKNSFPYKECEPEFHYGDAYLLTQLKERFCHMNFEQNEVQERSFEVHKGSKNIRYTLQVGDECIVAPLSLYYTDLLNITERNRKACIQITCSQQNDSEDCFDSEYIRETGRRNGRDQMLEGQMPITGETPDIDDVVVEAEEVVITERDNGLGNAKLNDKEELIYSTNTGQIFSLDQAIVHSIERCGSEEVKRKMFGCILLVGGTVKFSGFSKWLEQQVTTIMHRNSNRLSDLTNLEVNVFLKDMDACMIAWKGAAIMSCLESAPELWIMGPEFEKHGIRILREKAPFIW